jgi:predicted glycoside hydrolase/deacetylase ChbG (UPF0249 family)
MRTTELPPEELPVDLVIVNADDWGLECETTDSIAACYRAARVSSATAMVHMRDSARAAQVARAIGIPLGLHLNLIEPFDDPATPDEVRRRHARAVEYYARSRVAAWIYDPRVRGLLEACIEDQLREFRRLYGCDPTHVDGHRHIHTAPTVVRSRALSPVGRLRPSFVFDRSEKPRTKRAVRWLINKMIARRFTIPDRFLDIRQIYPALGASGPVRRSLPEGQIEVMVHPARRDEWRVLMSDTWGDALLGRRLGSYADLV